MKSKISSNKFHRATWKKQLWNMGILFAAFLAVLPLNFLIQMDRWNTTYSPMEERQQWFVEFMLMDRLEVVVIAAGILCAFTSWVFLHSRTKVDFYYSQPITRSVRLGQQTMLSYLNFVIPYTATGLLLMIIGGANGYVNGQIIGFAALLWLQAQLIFLVTYLVASIAIMLTGRVIVGVLGTLTLLGYGYVLYSVVNELENMFFSTFDAQHTINIWTFYLAPTYAADGIRRAFRQTNYNLPYTWDLQNGLIGLAVAVILVVVLYVIAYFLMKYRKGEVAGQGMAFPLIGRFFHVIVSVTGGLLISVVIGVSGSEQQTLWVLVCSVLGTCLIYVIMQFCYTGDLHNLWNGKWQFVFALVMSAACASVFAFDVTGYDKYLPAQDKIENVSLAFDSYNNSSVYYNNGDYVGAADYQLEFGNLGNDPDAYALMQKVVSMDQETDFASNDPIRLVAKYQLTNGTTVYRRYWVATEEVRASVEKLYDKQEYRKGACPLLNITDQDVIGLVDMNYGNELFTIFGSEDPRRLEFVKLFKQEIEQLPATVFTTQQPLAIMNIVYGEIGNSASIPVYPSCTNTIAYLKEQGREIQPLFTTENVKSITVTDARERLRAEDGEAEDVEIEDEVQETAEAAGATVTSDTTMMDEELAENIIVYTDQAAIDAMVPALIPASYYNSWVAREIGIYVDVEIETSQGYREYIGAYFDKANLPDMLK